MTTAVMMCGDGLGAVVRERLNSAVQVVDGLCRRPEVITTLDERFDGLVLVVHGDEIAEADFQAQLRASGLDPLGVPTLDAVGYEDDYAGLQIAIAGAKARVGAFPGSSPAHAKPVFPTRFTRRSLFTIPQPAYVAAPAIDPTTCASGGGCSMCVGVCPQDAYTWVEGRIVYDKNTCEPCGRCVTACPTGAISNPAATPAALAAQIESMVVVTGFPLGVAFRCRRARIAPLPDNWQAVELPCTGMVTAPWVVAPLVLGAAQVAVLTCSSSGCDRGLDSVAEEAVAFAVDLLDCLGIAPERVGLAPSGIVYEPLPAVQVDDPFGPRAAARVYGGLRTAVESAASSVAGDPAMLGIVSIDKGTCTMCTKCTQMCPTGALAGSYAEDGYLAISFDPVECTACDQCVATCPEARRGAITVDHRVDFTALAAGRIELNRSATHACERCGQPVAPTAMMDRISDILGDEPGLMDHLTRLCLSCRGVS